MLPNPTKIDSPKKLPHRGVTFFSSSWGFQPQTPGRDQPLHPLPGGVAPRYPLSLVGRAGKGNPLASLSPVQGTLWQRLVKGRSYPRGDAAAVRYTP